MQTVGQYITAWRSLIPLTEEKHIRQWTKTWRMNIPRHSNRKTQIISLFGEIWLKIPETIKIWMHIQYMLCPWYNWQVQWTTIKSVVRSMRWGSAQANKDRRVITVKEATVLIRDLGPRNQKWKIYTEQASGNLPENLIEKRIREVFRRLWRCEVLNRYKEPFWRLLEMSYTDVGWLWCG
jgi:hypothetical protein